MSLLKANSHLAQVKDWVLNDVIGGQLHEGHLVSNSLVTKSSFFAPVFDLNARLILEKFGSNLAIGPIVVKSGAVKCAFSCVEGGNMKASIFYIATGTIKRRYFII